MIFLHVKGRGVLVYSQSEKCRPISGAEQIASHAERWCDFKRFSVAP
jgi:hypothetical protein